MKEKIEEFKEWWRTRYAYISLDLTDSEIEIYLKQENLNVEIAADRASDFLLSQGIADVQL